MKKKKEATGDDDHDVWFLVARVHKIPERDFWLSLDRFDALPKSFRAQERHDDGDDDVWMWLTHWMFNDLLGGCVVVAWRKRRVYGKRHTAIKNYLLTSSSIYTRTQRSKRVIRRRDGNKCAVEWMRERVSSLVDRGALFLGCGRRLRKSRGD